MANLKREISDTVYGLFFTTNVYNAMHLPRYWDSSLTVNFPIPKPGPSFSQQAPIEDPLLVPVFPVNSKMSSKALYATYHARPDSPPRNPMLMYATVPPTNSFSAHLRSQTNSLQAILLAERLEKEQEVNELEQQLNTMDAAGTDHMTPEEQDENERRRFNIRQRLRSLTDEDSNTFSRINIGNRASTPPARITQRASPNTRRRLSAGMDSSEDFTDENCTTPEALSPPFSPPVADRLSTDGTPLMAMLPNKLVLAVGPPPARPSSPLPQPLPVRQSQLPSSRLHAVGSNDEAVPGSGGEGPGASSASGRTPRRPPLTDFANATEEDLEGYMFVERFYKYLDNEEDIEAESEPFATATLLLKQLGEVNSDSGTDRSDQEETQSEEDYYDPSSYEDSDDPVRQAFFRPPRDPTPTTSFGEVHSAPDTADPLRRVESFEILRGSGGSTGGGGAAGLSQSQGRTTMLRGSSMTTLPSSSAINNVSGERLHKSQGSPHLMSALKKGTSEGGGGGGAGYLKALERDSRQKARRGTWGATMNRSPLNEWEHNSEWQEALENVRRTVPYQCSNDERELLFSRMLEIYSTFTDTVRECTLTIINELCLMPTQKTIKVNETEKDVYVSKGITFTVADLEKDARKAQALRSEFVGYHILFDFIYLSNPKCNIPVIPFRLPIMAIIE
eukprot:TRINITY_DN7514_c0_g1_i1.p1 TRINITY_DN7514_c0_g1~~TRINITY_DN7514_c0_g1_i1.p1  ORF type:complete len:726 (-),score=139.42 TRINITY_DN7514_c0_g1_i1:36-2063(-)